MQQTFIQRIAAAYTANVGALEMADMCFVFPNKRSGAFFRKALEESADKSAPRIEPQITTIADFVAEMSHYVRAPRFELLFTLYDAYRQLSAEVDDFDKFVFWGDMLLADFNDADMYMADTSGLFRNLKDLKEINADYLTDEQRDVISRYWNMPVPLADPDKFWTHIHHEGEPRTNRDSFLKLWEILQPLYEAFSRNLDERGLSYSGRQFREVALRLASTSDDRPFIPYTRIVFAGFNVLSVSEVKIFEGLSRMGLADFYWDSVFPTEMEALTRQASTFVRRYSKAFPSLYDIGTPEAPECPHIDIVSVPSAVGQVKYAGQLLRSMADDRKFIADPSNAIETAVVLPVESLFIDMLHSLPDNIPAVNITMGYPLKLTPVAQLIRAVTSMHLRAGKVGGNWCFFYEDVVEVLASPLLASVVGEECEELRKHIETDRLFSIPVEYIKQHAPGLEAVFYPVNDTRDAESVFAYSLKLVDFLTEILNKHEKTDTDVTESDDPEETQPGMPADNLELGFLYAYRRALESLSTVAASHGIKMHESTFFQLIERTIGSETVNFVGEPLHGLQIMGVLETRVLSFKNVIMLSMNERVFPQRHFSRSFIPETLRRSYGMCTTEFQECVFAYHFMRLISSAENVTLIYDTRTQGVNSGDMSRYLYQLLYNMPPGFVNRISVSYEMPTVEPHRAVEVAKTPRIMEEINKYAATEPPMKYLSASSINDLVSCPLKFYFKHIEQLKVKEDIVDYMDEGLFGTILHQVAEKSFNRMQTGVGPLLVTEKVIDRLKAEEITMRQLITSAINEHYNKFPSQSTEKNNYENFTPLVGEAKVIGNVMLKLMKLLLDEERKRVPFEFLAAELKIKHPVAITPELTVNLIGSIDRVDRLADGTIAIIDYKTGSDNTDVKKPEHLFESVSEEKGHEKAILQLFVYSNAYSQIASYNGPIKPLIYKFRTLASDGIANVTIGKQPLTDYRDYNAFVTEHLAAVLADLFNPDIPFKACPSKSNCNFCTYGRLCGKE